MSVSASGESSQSVNIVPCSVGGRKNIDCHKTAFTNSIGLINVTTLSTSERKLLSVRSGVEQEQLITVCQHHYKFYLKRYETFQKSCFDPFGVHKKGAVKKALRPVSFEYANNINQIRDVKAKPGQKICSNCRNSVSLKLRARAQVQEDPVQNINVENLSNEDAEAESLPSVDAEEGPSGNIIVENLPGEDSEADSLLSAEQHGDATNVESSSVKKLLTDMLEELQPDTSSSEGLTEESQSEFDKSGLSLVPNLEKTIAREKSLEEVNETLEGLGESPLILHSLNPHRRKTYVQRKLRSVSKVLEKKFENVLDEPRTYSEEQKKADDFDIFISELKGKLEDTTSYRHKIQLLTLVPQSWSLQKKMREFGVSKYAIRKAIELRQEKGILALPDPRRGKPMDQNVIQSVVAFYQDDEFSRILPGQKDRVSISKNTYEQKRLLLCDLSVLYSAFKVAQPTLKIGFSKFCALRPKWCKFAGSSGTHAVCVCTIHENVALMLQSAGFSETYKNLIPLLVCSTENRDCMLRHCADCPTNENLKNYLIAKFDDWQEDDEITYSEWVSTDRAKQVEITVTFYEYIDTLIRRIEKLVPHSFISKSQCNYLKTLKSHLPYETCIIVVDFSENFTFVIQNEIQSYHWANESCSVFPVVVYTRPQFSEEIVVSSICVLSEDLEHDVGFVYASQKIITDFVRKQFPSIKKAIYFSDGCAAQFKNCKNFLNLCFHESDFSLTAEWAFFATSHGKSASDGIGGTVKRLVTKASLQMSAGTLNSTRKVFEFCKENISNIEFVIIEKETLSDTRQQLEARFLKAKTVPGTRSFHHIIPLSKHAIGAKRLSSDDEFSLEFKFDEEPSTALKLSQINTNTYISCIYDNHWFFGLILQKSEEEDDICVKFMHPFGPSPSFHWPQGRDDICYVPITNVISQVSPPTTSGSGRVYYFTEEESSFAQQKLVQKHHRS